MDQLRWQRLPPFQKLAAMLVKHLDGILNYCRTKVRFGVESFLQLKGIELTAVTWVRQAPRAILLNVADTLRNREQEVTFDQRLITGIADEDQAVRDEAQGKIEALLRAR